MCCTHLNRRDFLGLTTGMAAVGLASSAFASAGQTEWPPDAWDPDRPYVCTGKPLRVQPVLMYRVAERKQAASWKSWGGILSEEVAAEEVAHIARELDALAAEAGFPLDVRPLVKVTTLEEARAVHSNDYDVVLLYPASGWGHVLHACFAPDRDTLLFVRHQSGPVYYWYEALSVKYLDTEDEPAAPHRPSVHDVVVDDYGEVLWRLRALYAVKNFLGTRIVALGGPWGKYAPDAPEFAQTKHGIKIIEVDYADFAPRIQGALADPGRVARAQAWTEQYLALPNTTLTTEKGFVVNAFVLYALFKELMAEHDAPAFTIKDCMGTILPMAQTTACLSLSLLNDEGLLAFCESDFVVIPCGILLHYLSGTPVFLHNSTFPHQGLATCAHCSAPRRMNAARYEPAAIMTHYESEYGAAPKVDIPQGQEVTFIDPEYSTGRWIGFKGIVQGNPFYPICRSQQDVQIQGEWKRLIKEVRDSHWMMAYGDYLRDLEYASRKIGIRWECIS